MKYIHTSAFTASDCVVLCIIKPTGCKTENSMRQHGFHEWKRIETVVPMSY